MSGCIIIMIIVMLKMGGGDEKDRKGVGHLLLLCVVKNVKNVKNVYWFRMK